LRSGLQFVVTQPSSAEYRGASTVYTSGLDQEIIPIDTATNTAGIPIRPPGDNFLQMQVSLDGKTLLALAATGFLDRINAAAGTSSRRSASGGPRTR
jgi:hypothetical protein